MTLGMLRVSRGGFYYIPGLERDLRTMPNESIIGIGFWYWLLNQFSLRRHAEVISLYFDPDKNVGTSGNDPYRKNALCCVCNNGIEGTLPEIQASDHDTDAAAGGRRLRRKRFLDLETGRLPRETDSIAFAWTRKIGAD